MPKGPETILLGYVLPPLIVALCMLVAWRPWATARYTLSEVDEGVRDPRHRLPRGWWGSALGIGLATVVAHFVLGGKVLLPIESSYEWRFAAAVGIVPIALVLSVVRLPLWALLGVRLLVSTGAVAGVVSLRFVNEQWEIGAGMLRVAGLALAITLVWSAMDAIASRLRGATPVIIAAGLCLASAPMLIFEAAYASAGDVAIAMGVLLVPAILLAWWRGPISIARGGVGVVCLMLGLLWSDAVAWQGGINPWQGAAFVVAPLCALVWVLPWMQRRRAWVRRGLTIGAVALLPTVAVLEALSRVNWKEYGIDLPQLRGGGDGTDAEDDFEYVW